MKNKVTNRIGMALLSATLLMGTVSMPASAEESVGSWKSKVMLPSAGVTYALSVKKVSLRDVENKLVRTGKMTNKIKKKKITDEELAAVATTWESISEGVANNAAVAATAEAVVEDEKKEDAPETAVDENAEEIYLEELEAIVDTTLTAVQTREKAVVQRVQLQKQADVIDTEEVSEREAILAAARAPKVTDAELNAPIIRESDHTVVVAEPAKVTEAPDLSESSAEAVTEETETAAEAATEAATEETTEAEETEEDAKSGLVVAQVEDFVNVRESASTDSDIVGKLYANAVGEIVEEAADGWVKIKSGSVTGYVKKEFVASGSKAKEIAEAVSTDKAVVTTETLRVRAAASTESDVISLIGQGQALKIISEEGNFYKISTPDGDGYISKDFADIEKVYPDAVSIEDEKAKSTAQLSAADQQRKADAARKEANEAKKKAEEALSKAKTTAEKKAAQELQTAADEAQSAAETAQKTADDAQVAADKADAEAAAAAAKSKSSSSSSGKSASNAAPASGKGQQVVNYALQFVGNPYVWGGTSLTNGADCSGFTMAVYSHFGVSLPHYDGAQRSCGTAVNSLAEARPGDLICYYGHVGIYMGNGQIVHASNPATGITTGSATYRQIAGIRRIFN